MKTTKYVVVAHKFGADVQDLTLEKEYPLVGSHPGATPTYGTIRDDAGAVLQIFFKKSAHLGFKPWELKEVSNDDS